MLIHPRTLVPLVVALLVPSVALASPLKHRRPRTARVHRTESAPPVHVDVAPEKQEKKATSADESTSKINPRACVKAPVEVIAGAESATFSLAKCDGTPAPLAVDQLSVLARPGTVAKPKQPMSALSGAHHAELAPGIHRVDARLIERLERAVDHFRKATEAARVVLVSGYRPRSTGSYHSSGRALDFRIDGVTDEALVAFCKTLPDTGCGYYPNGGFVHMDVRDVGAGHVSWTDVSRPGESPRYSASAPAVADAVGTNLPPLPGGGSDARDDDRKSAKDDRSQAF
jgi:hypothetical protein